MSLERDARVALARLEARRFGRSVPVEELAWEMGLPPTGALDALTALQENGVAMKAREGGWRLVSAPVRSRVREECASFSWIHGDL